MNIKEVITLTRDLNIIVTLSTRKSTIKVQKFKKLIIFRIIFEKNKKTLKLNDF